MEDPGKKAARPCLPRQTSVRDAGRAPAACFDWLPQNPAARSVCRATGPGNNLANPCRLFRCRKLLGVEIFTKSTGSPGMPVLSFCQLDVFNGFDVSQIWHGSRFEHSAVSPMHQNPRGKHEELSPRSAAPLTWPRRPAPHLGPTGPEPIRTAAPFIGSRTIPPTSGDRHLYQPPKASAQTSVAPTIYMMALPVRLSAGRQPAADHRHRGAAVWAPNRWCSPQAIANPVFAFVSLNGNGCGFDQD